jgi:predicted enzyme related to lactoylglutathione lyase
MANVNNWFEIPISSIERTFKFYSEVLGGELNQMEIMGTKMAIFQID